MSLGSILRYYCLGLRVKIGRGWRVMRKNCCGWFVAENEMHEMMAREDVLVERIHSPPVAAVEQRRWLLFVAVESRLELTPQLGYAPRWIGCFPVSRQTPF